MSHRAPFNALMFIYTPLNAGGPLPLVNVVPCRLVLANQILNVDPIYHQSPGYVTYDPPDFLFAPVTYLPGSGLFFQDMHGNSLVEISSQPGAQYGVWRIEEVTTDDDHYYRAWLLPLTF